MPDKLDNSKNKLVGFGTFQTKIETWRDLSSQTAKIFQHSDSEAEQYDSRLEWTKKTGFNAGRQYQNDAETLQDHQQWERRGKAGDG